MFSSLKKWVKNEENPQVKQPPAGLQTMQYNCKLPYFILIILTETVCSVCLSTTVKCCMIFLMDTWHLLIYLSKYLNQEKAK